MRGGGEGGVGGMGGGDRETGREKGKRGVARFCVCVCVCVCVAGGEGVRVSACGSMGMVRGQSEIRNALLN